MVNKKENFTADTFLCDQYRSGRLTYGKGNLNEPQIRWSRQLPNHPSRGAESTAVIDENGNLYFGCHDGCFYSLDANGKVRWTFRTEQKIYSSPALVNNTVLFGGGNGYLYCLDLSGKLLWSYDIAADFRQQRFLKKAILLGLHAPYQLDVGRRQFSTIKCWASPNVDSAGQVYITGFGVGLHALDVKDGTLLWQVDLGWPRFHTSGVVIGGSGEVYVSSQGGRLFRIDSKTGKIIWAVNHTRRHLSWASPSLDLDYGHVIFPLTRRENSSVILAVNKQGGEVWRCQLPTGVRGSVTISFDDFAVVCGLDGKLYLIERRSGKLVRSFQIAGRSRGLWTSAVIDRDNFIYLTTKDSNTEGRICCFNVLGEEQWAVAVGKSLSVPLFDSCNRLYLGSWDGSFKCLQT